MGLVVAWAFSSFGLGSPGDSEECNHVEMQLARRYPHVDIRMLTGNVTLSLTTPLMLRSTPIPQVIISTFTAPVCLVCRQTWRCGGRSKCWDNFVLIDKYSLSWSREPSGRIKKYLPSSARFLLVGHLAIFTMTGDDIKKDVGEELRCDILDGFDVDIPDRARKEKALLRRVDSRMMPLMMILCKLSLDHSTIGVQKAYLYLT